MMASANAQSSALENISDGCTPRALATRNRLSAVTFRSPRSILPIWDRSIPALYAKASCDTLCALRTSRIAWPKAFRRRSSSSVRGLLDTAAPSQQVQHKATAFTDEVVTDYDYGPSTGATNLLLRGTVVTATNSSDVIETQRSCYTYDEWGRKLSETKPLGTGSTCP